MGRNMKVKLLVSRAGIHHTENIGDEIEVDADEGLRMIEAGQAEACGPASLVQIAKHTNRFERAVKKLFGEKAVADE